jgi:predicted kinase
MLIVFAGLPGTGKTTIARELARQIRAVYLRIDSIEQAIRESGVCPGSLDDAGYRVAYEVALDNLRLGRTVVADSVNPIPLTRDAWHSVAEEARVPVVDIELVCSDTREHQRRVESRVADIHGHKLPTWQEVVDRQYSGSWSRAPHVIDTAGRTARECTQNIRALLAIL